MSNDTAKWERLGEIKAELKKLTKEGSKIQTQLLDVDEPLTEVETKSGTLGLSTRINYETVDKEAYITLFGGDAFIKAATLSVSGVKKEFGQTGLDALDKGGLVVTKAVSKYYSLRG